MPTNSIMVLMGILTLLLIIAVIIPMALKPGNEGFVNSRSEYIRIGQMRYNKLSDTKNITKSNFFGATQTDAGNKEIAAATSTTEMREDDTSPTGISTRSTAPRLTLAPPSEMLAESNKCESKRGRTACGALGDGEFARCGVCIKGGTAFSLPDEAGSFIGGLLVLPEDKEAAKAEAAGGSTPLYQPSIGECPAGSFFVSRAACEEAANRADCEEVGASGGFDGRTIEGKKLGDKCASIGTESGADWVYDPKNRDVRVMLRVVAPVGTGITRVIVKNSSGQTVGTAENRRGDGMPFVVAIPQANEGARFTLTFIQEVPYRQSEDASKAEVFQYEVNQQGPSAARYNLEKSAAQEACNRIGARLATREEVVAAQTAGAQVCSAGWTTSASVYPIQAAAPGCGSEPGVINWNNPSDLRANAWCFGLKPPQKVTNMALFTRIFSWFTTLGAAASPSQEDIPSQWSQHGGGEYQTPFRRAILAQWESVDGTRKADLTPSILKIDEISPNSAGVFTNLRKFGTLQNSGLILQPRAVSVPSMLADKQWIWSNQPNSQQMILEVFVPGTFLAPFYEADSTTISAPLITKKETLQMLRASPCDGQNPGSYNSECLTAIFIGEGGDIDRGELTRNLEALNRIGSGKEDEIRAYLRELYNVATTGKGSGGMPATRDVINDAAKKLFGFELVSPCEDISINEAGGITLVPKSGAIDADCLQWLWHNTGNDRERGNTDLTRKTRIPNTYTLLSDRYSGLRSREGSAAERAAAPFRACQDTGSMAPKDKRGTVRPEAVRAAMSRGGVLEIQDFYDSIHRSANYRGTSVASAAEHAKALQQCYGISKAPDAPFVGECGPKARYIRVLVSGHSSASNTEYTPIQIPQIQVFDGKGREVARGKPTSAATFLPGSAAEFAVNGDARPHSHSEGEYHDNGLTPRRQFWMVDLGSEMDISRIVYYPRTDCCWTHQIGAPVQLLNTSRRVVAVKYLGSVNVPAGRWSPQNPERIPITPRDGKPAVARTALTDGTRVSFMSATSFERYMRHAGYVFWSHGPDSGAANYSQLMKLDASFIIRVGSGGLRFESVNFPEFFISVGNGGRLALQKNTPLSNSTFSVEDAINGDPAAVSLKVGGNFVATDSLRPDIIGLSSIDLGDVWDLQRGAWRIVPALA